MRLGDLDALKKAIKSYADDQYAENEYLGECAIMAIIDNAPTVEITEEQAIDKLHATGWLPRHDKEMTERPQGEWIYHGLDNCLWGQMECPFCHRRSNSDADFCQYCGASMKGAIKDE